MIRSTRRNQRRHRLGVYIPGNGHSGPWRSVHSILAGIDPGEFEVVLLSGLDRYEPRPIITADPDPRREPLTPTAGPVSPGAVAGSPGRRGLSALIPPAGRLWLGFAREVGRLAAWFRRHRLDLLHTHNTGCEESPAAGRAAGIPRVVGTFHVDPSYDLDRVRDDPGHRLLECLSTQCLDVGIGVSRATTSAWVRRTHFAAGRGHTIHNGIDPTKYRRRQARDEARAALRIPVAAGPVIGGVGRLDPSKGFEDLLTAAARLIPDHPNLYVVIAGEGPIRGRLVTSAETLGIADRVSFLGFCRDVQPVYDAIDVFALPSLCETLGYAHLEAMSSGLPAVGTLVGGVPEVIVPGLTGFLVRPRDPAALATALHRLAVSPALRQRLGAAGRERVLTHFQERDMIRRTIELYRRTLVGVRPSAGPFPEPVPGPSRVAS